MLHPVKQVPVFVVLLTLGFGCMNEPTVPAKAVAIPPVSLAPQNESIEVKAPSRSHKSTRKPVYLGSVSKGLDDELSAGAQKSLSERVARQPKKKDYGIVIIGGGGR
jgi:hypothetical protein